ncbi:hypothetical protein BDQ12DRAFT_75245 [Crucibulum laeve]|uniref:Uncharacterized protein n=1 Tax=Crucibulum laeve TaxID=68775 RepID=A0A5C3M5Y3_9AGAR|nr:hypothetical protein BDQ12DRAFT_75245 [Crucibulum laeve]
MDARVNAGSSIATHPILEANLTVWLLVLCVPVALTVVVVLVRPAVHLGVCPAGYKVRGAMDASDLSFPCTKLYCACSLCIYLHPWSSNFATFHHLAISSETQCRIECTSRPITY